MHGPYTSAHYSRSRSIRLGRVRGRSIHRDQPGCNRHKRKRREGILCYKRRNLGKGTSYVIPSLPIESRGQKDDLSHKDAAMNINFSEGVESRAKQKRTGRFFLATNGHPGQMHRQQSIRSPSKRGQQRKMPRSTFSRRTGKRLPCVASEELSTLGRRQVRDRRNIQASPCNYTERRQMRPRKGTTRD